MRRFAIRGCVPSRPVTVARSAPPTSRSRGSVAQQRPRRPRAARRSAARPRGHERRQPGARELVLRQRASPSSRRSSSNSRRPSSARGTCRPASRAAALVDEPAGVAGQLLEQVLRRPAPNRRRPAGTACDSVAANSVHSDRSPSTRAERGPRSRQCSAARVATPCVPRRLARRPRTAVPRPGRRRVPQQPGTGAQPQQAPRESWRRRGRARRARSPRRTRLGRPAHDVRARPRRSGLAHRRAPTRRGTRRGRPRASPHQQLVPERLGRRERRVGDRLRKSVPVTAKHSSPSRGTSVRSIGCGVHREAVPAEPDRLAAVLEQVRRGRAATGRLLPRGLEPAVELVGPDRRRASRRSSATDAELRDHRVGREVGVDLVERGQRARPGGDRWRGSRSAECTSRSARRARSSSSVCLRAENAS